MKNQNYNDNIMQAENSDMTDTDSKTKRVLSRVKSSLPTVMNKGKSAGFLIPALAVLSLALIGYRYYSKKRSDDTMSDDFAASLDDTSIEHGQVGAA